MGKFKHIAIELKKHLPFTAFGAFVGIIIMSAVYFFGNLFIPSEVIFHILHPFHIFLSAFVTTSMYRRYRGGIFTPLEGSFRKREDGIISSFLVVRKGFKVPSKLLTGFTSLFVGFIGSVGICSLSDIVLPFVGGLVLGLKIYWHLCLIQHPYIVIFSAIIGSLIGYLKPTTKCPHAMHILISTGASLFYLLGFGLANWLKFLPPIFLLLFFAVWLPCCTSDIIFPLLFVSHSGEKR